jgi:broad specificity phosphatase PhoE
MALFFIRHGETDYNKERRLQGNLDIALNENGRQQAYEAVPEIEKLKIDRIISSPQKRALETARILSEEIGIERIEIDADLRERSFGILEGMSFEEILEKHPHFMKVITEPQGVLVPDSETITEVETRVTAFIERIKQLTHEENVLVVSHGGTGRVFHKIINQAPGFERMELGNCQVIAFEL